jgi:hypothetical protein
MAAGAVIFLHLNDGKIAFVFEEPLIFQQQ